MVQGVTGKAVLPEKELAPKTWLEGELAKGGQKLDDFYQQVADEVKQNPPTDEDLQKFAFYADHAGQLRVNAQDQEDLASGLTNAGINDQRIVQGVVAAVAISAFLAPIFGEGMGFGF